MSGCCDCVGVQFVISRGINIRILRSPISKYIHVLI